MATFKEQLSADLDLFLNLDEFAEPHRINKTSGVACIFDKADEPIKKGFPRYEGTEKDKAMLYIRKTDLPGKVSNRTIITVDNSEYRINTVNSNNGLYELTLEAVR